MDTKIIGIILLVCAGLVFQYSYDDFLASFFSPAAKLKSSIESDISKSLSEEIPETKSDIHHIKFVYRSMEAMNFLKKYPPQFQTNKDGKIWLEVEVLDLQDNESPGLITQTSIFDIKSKNKIGEFGQTYYYKDFDKNFRIKIPDPSTETKTSIEKENSRSESKEETTKTQK